MKIVLRHDERILDVPRKLGSDTHRALITVSTISEEKSELVSDGGIDGGTRTISDTSRV